MAVVGILALNQQQTLEQSEQQRNASFLFQRHFSGRLSVNVILKKDEVKAHIYIYALLYLKITLLCNLIAYTTVVITKTLSSFILFKLKTNKKLHEVYI